MKAKNSVHAIEMVSINVADFTGVDDYIVLSAGLPEACFILRLINDSDTDAFVSHNGVEDNDYSIAGTDIQITVPNSQVDRANFQKGGTVYLAGLPQGTGRIYLAGYYRDQSIS